MQPGASSVSRNLLFGTLADVKKAPETSSSRPSAYIDTVGRKLRRKLKCNIICEFRTLLKIFRSENQSKKARKSSLGKFCILTVRGFIDSLRGPEGILRAAALFQTARLGAGLRIIQICLPISLQEEALSRQAVIFRLDQRTVMRQAPV